MTSARIPKEIKGKFKKKKEGEEEKKRRWNQKKPRRCQEAFPAVSPWQGCTCWCCHRPRSRWSCWTPAHCSSWWRSCHSQGGAHGACPAWGAHWSWGLEKHNKGVLQAERRSRELVAPGSAGQSHQQLCRRSFLPKPSSLQKLIPLSSWKTFCPAGLPSP